MRSDHGSAGEDGYGDAVVRDPQIVALRDKVIATGNKGIREDEAHIVIRLRDGGRPRRSSKMTLLYS